MVGCRRAGSTEGRVTTFVFIDFQDSDQTISAYEEILMRSYILSIGRINFENYRECN